MRREIEWRWEANFRMGRRMRGVGKRVVKGT